MEVSNIIGTYIDHKKGWETINKHTVFNSEDSFMSNNLILEIWT